MSGVSRRCPVCGTKENDIVGLCMDPNCPLIGMPGKLPPTEMERKTVKLCVDCKHHLKFDRPTQLGPVFTLDVCRALTGQPEPVHGSVIGDMDCGTMRLGPCGLRGRLWRAVEKTTKKT